MTTLPADMQSFLDLAQRRLPGLIGLRVDRVERGFVEAHLEIREDLLAPNGYLHAATVVGLADSACGVGTFASLPPAARGFTTVEVKCNFLRSAVAGTLACDARMQHGGRTTQVWDATVLSADGRTVALFRCTQLLLV